MFGFLKKSFELIAPVDGKVIDLSKVPDQVFAEKMAGDGVGIESTGDVVVAPADGTIALIFKTNHAFAMTLNNGAEVLVHIGIDTVELNGEGFERLVEQGKEVKAGEAVIKLNRELIESKGYSLVTPIIITNSDEVKDISYNTDIVAKAGKDVVVTYKTK